MKIKINTVWGLMLFFGTVYPFQFLLAFVAIIISLFNVGNYLKYWKIYSLLYVVIILASMNFLYATLFLAYEFSLFGPWTALLMLPLVSSCNYKVFYVFVLLVASEVIIGSAQFLLGFRSFFYEVPLEDTGFLYNKAVLGLSSSSSSFAFKILMAQLLLYIYWEKYSSLKLFLLVILHIGLVITFNRTGIASSIMLSSIFILLRSQDSLRVRAWSAIIVVIVAALLITNANTLLSQFFRGRFTAFNYSDLDLSGRQSIWYETWLFIVNNPLTGNFSHDYGIWKFGSLYHAHNSYLQFIAENGFIISLIFFIFLFWLVFKVGIWLMPILVFGLSQTTLFNWFAWADIIILSLYFHSFTMIKENERPHINND